MKEIIIIVAIANLGMKKNGNVIGKDNDIPWHISEDLKRFKTLTMGHTVIMGRNTYESIPENVRPLPGRKNIVITSDREYCGEGIETFSTLGYALKSRLDEEKVFIIGGARLYEEALPMADTLEITKVEGKYEGDVFFPEVNYDDWVLVEEEKGEGFSFLTYRRK